MYPAPFEYHRAESVDEALTLLAQYADDAKLIAGGHSLLPVMKLRFSQPSHLIDIRRVPGLAGIREEDGALCIGATTTHAAVASSDVIRHRVPVLAEAGEVGVGVDGVEALPEAGDGGGEDSRLLLTRS